MEPRVVFFLHHREVPLPSSSSFSCPPQGQGEGTADTSDNNLFAPLLGFLFLFCFFPSCRTNYNNFEF